MRIIHGPEPTVVAYLINQYPKVSHSFIRREIEALEALGLVVRRFALRGWNHDTVDAADAAERERTHYLLRRGVAGLVWGLLITILASPLSATRALALALRLARQSDRGTVFHLAYLAEAAVLAQAMRKSGCVHLHAHFGTNSAEVALLARAFGGPPFSFTVHGPEEFDRPVSLHLGTKILSSAFVVAISSYGRSQLYRWIDPSHWKKVHVVHCGLAADSFEERTSAAPYQSSRTLVCVGRICEQKGQLLLVEAAARLVSEGVDLALVFAGDGEMRNQLEAASRRLGIESRVRVTGWIDASTVREEIRCARALVLPSFAEGLPVVLMEALALARPVITTYVAGIPELVRDGREGWLVPAGDVVALASALRACLSESEQKLREMGESGRARVRERHLAETEAKRLLQLFVSTGTPAATPIYPSAGR